MLQPPESRHVPWALNTPKNAFAVGARGKKWQLVAPPPEAGKPSHGTTDTMVHSQRAGNTPSRLASQETTMRIPNFATTCASVPCQTPVSYGLRKEFVSFMMSSQWRRHSVRPCLFTLNLFGAGLHYVQRRAFLPLPDFYATYNQNRF